MSIKAAVNVVDREMWSHASKVQCNETLPLVHVTGFLIRPNNLPRKGASFFHLQQFLDRGFYEIHLGIYDQLLFLVYNFTVESTLGSALAVKLQSAALRRPYSIRLKGPM